MKPKTRDFKNGASAAIGNQQIQSNLKALYSGFNQARIKASDETPGWEEMRDRAREIKTHTINNLDYYLELTERNVLAAGGKVFFATDADSASKYVVEVARSNGVGTVIKSKSMLSEEMDLNLRLKNEGIDPVETDLGEYIIQLADETPFHIIAPAIHKSKADVSKLFQDKHNTQQHETISDLASEARGLLRDKFIQADMGVTGVNFVVAETGTVVLVTNEGNGRMCTSMPRIHVAIMGMEKVVPSMEDMGLFLRLLVRSATGQRISSYVTTVTGPKNEQCEDGPEEFHLVIVDNGRTRLLADEELKESLNCLRCGACLNACPVYRKVGGHSYGWVYPGPIGAIVSPMLTNLSESRHLPHASTLCGNCREVCPVRIDMPRMLLHLRKELAVGDRYPDQRSVPVLERLVMKLWRISVANAFTIRIANLIGRLVLTPLDRVGLLHKIPGPISAWSKHRDFPGIASVPFRERWAKR